MDQSVAVRPVHPGRYVLTTKGWAEVLTETRKAGLTFLGTFGGSVIVRDPATLQFLQV